MKNHIPNTCYLINIKMEAISILSELNATPIPKANATPIPTAQGKPQIHKQLLFVTKYKQIV